MSGTVCEQHKCPSNNNVIACIPSMNYHNFIEDICKGDMPWAKIDVFPEDDLTNPAPWQHSTARSNK
jgi:hypothetical protein